MKIFTLFSVVCVLAVFCASSVAACGLGFSSGYAVQAQVGYVQPQVAYQSACGIAAQSTYVQPVVVQRQVVQRQVGYVQQFNDVHHVQPVRVQKVVVQRQNFHHHRGGLNIVVGGRRGIFGLRRW